MQIKVRNKRNGKVYVVKTKSKIRIPKKGSRKVA